MRYNLLIADDEKIYRSSLANVISNAFDDVNVLEACNGQEALELIESTQIDGMLLDIRMPKMDGTQVIQRMTQEQRARIVTVIVSGFNDFEYARTAIQGNIFDYMLKPITPKEAIGLVGQLLEEADHRQKEREEHHALRSAMEQLKPQIRLQLFQNILCNRFTDEQLFKQAEFLGIDLHAGAYQCAAVEVQVHSTFADHAFEQTQLKSMQLEEMFSVCMPDDLTSYSFQVQSDLFVLVFCFQTVLPGTDERLLAALDQLNAQVQTQIGIWLISGIGRLCTSLREIGRSYAEACNTLHYQTLRGDPSRAYAVTDFDSRKTCYGYFTFDSVCMMLKSRNEEALLETVHQMIHTMQAQGTEPAALSIMFQKFTTAIYQTLDEFDVDITPYSVPMQQGLFAPLRMKNLMQAQAWLEDLVRYAVKQLDFHDNQTNSRLVASIRQYFDTNYRNPVNNTTLAEAMGYSSNYLGQIFKNETGSSIGEYLRAVRIKKAKYLLVNTLKKVNDIAEMVGFSNNQYFGNVFKKEVGMTPKEYRDLHPDGGAAWSETGGTDV